MNNQKNYKKGIRREIIELTLAIGFLPFKSIELVWANKKSTQKKIRIMQEEGVLDEYHACGIWIVGLNDYARKSQEYLKYIDNEQLVKQYENFGSDDNHRVRNAPKQERTRVMRNNEAYLFMYGAGLQCKVAEKSSLQKEKMQGVKNSYYTSREVKAYDDFQADFDKSKLLNTTRMNGLAITDAGSYVIYNVGKELLRFNYGELKIKVYVENMLAQTEQLGLQGGLILAHNLATQIKYIYPGTPRKESQLATLESAYNHLYLITHDKSGQKMMKIMSQKNWEQKIYETMLQPEQRNIQNELIECDGQEDNIYYFVFCVPDIKRFKQFLYWANIEEDKERYRIICFDTQKELVLQVASKNCTVYTTSFDAYYEYAKEEN